MEAKNDAVEDEFPGFNGMIFGVHVSFRGVVSQVYPPKKDRFLMPAKPWANYSDLSRGHPQFVV